MNISRIHIICAVIFILFFAGCSTNSQTGSPIEPFTASDNLDSSRVIGSGRIQIDSETMTATVIPDRNVDFHFNVTGYLGGGCPGGCFRFRIIDITSDIFTVELTIENPTSIQVWDVRIFLFNILSKTVLNPDGFSDYYTDAIWVPFIDFRKEDPARVFPAGPGSIDTEILKIDFSGYTGNEISYLIEAGVGEQFVEPVQIDPPIVEGVFFSNHGMGGRVIAGVLDHQGDAVVTLDAFEIGLEDMPMYDDGLHGDGDAGDNIFGSDYMIASVPPGRYDLIVEATTDQAYPTIIRPFIIEVYPIAQTVFIPAGEFLMGCGESDPYFGEDWVADEKPLHTHPTGAYNIGKYEVTNGEFAAFVNNGGYFNSDWWSVTGWLIREDMGLMEPIHWNDPNYAGPLKLNYPIIGLNYYEVEAFCNWLSAMTGESWRLPGEAEWERAARGDGSENLYPWGSVWNDNYCNSTRDNHGFPVTSPVGEYSPEGDSPWGCADMLGNAAEWTRDFYKSDIYTQYQSGNFNPPASGSQKVTRGGVWWTNQYSYFRNSFRWNKSMVDQDDGNGFRLLREVE